MKSARPKCPVCGSRNLFVTGFISFTWSGGKWRPQRRGAEIADGAPIHCEGCYARLGYDDVNNPAAGLREESAV